MKRRDFLGESYLEVAISVNVIISWNVTVKLNGVLQSLSSATIKQLQLVAQCGLVANKNTEQGSVLY